MKTEFSLISSINRKINSGMILSDLLASIMDVTKELLRAEGSSLLLCDPETKDLVFNVVVGEKGDIIQGQRVPRGQGIAGTVAETGKAVMVNDVQNDPRFFKGIDMKADFMTRNILCLPMIVMDELVGVLEIVNSKERDSFDDIDLQKGQYIADQAALAITNRRLYDNLQKRIDELSALFTISQAVAQSTDDDSILPHIIQSLAQSMEVEKASIIIYDEESAQLRIEASYGLPEFLGRGYAIDPDNSIIGHVFHTGKHLIATDIEKEEMRHVLARDKDYKTSSFISIPIIYKNNIIGVISLTDKKNREKFDSFDLRVLTTASSQIAETYQGVRNRKFSEMQKRLSRELEIASEIQKKILPKIPERFREHRLAAYNRPAKEVGGDFYDLYKCDENKYAVLVADISGKGIPAAIFMGSARNIIRAEMNVDAMPSRLLKNINRLIYRESEFGMFVTLFYALVDSHNNIMTYGSAGHEDQLLIRSRTGEMVKLNAKGSALGIVENQDFEEKVIMFEPGDFLVMVTDGVIECLGGRDLDVEKGGRILADLAVRYSNEGPEALISHLKNDLDNTSVERDFRDDFTIFAIQF
ncbi:MAG TPA: SpoIIE family protein phosphatase [Spirochaetota bacterium]|nr:SpoIIE family protein phosphatase [Spirochaetota bacterium]HRZ26023.1 SpoIIE family protein phosphatase [Spirochaetota bacterium]HSA16528.1 SpoIIE family protein phosphatase [Spirochaetota bacterium]